MSSETVKHMRVGRHTACGIPLWGDGANRRVKWANDLADADCPECVMNALPFTILPLVGNQP